MKFELPNDDIIRYHGLMRVWHDRTAMLSVTCKDHPAFLEILSMKDKIDLIKLALWDLENYCHNSFLILRTVIPEENQPIVSEKMRGKINDLKNLWYEWGKKNGYFN
jgi:hypothetical protein